MFYINEDNMNFEKVLDNYTLRFSKFGNTKLFCSKIMKYIIFLEVASMYDIGNRIKELRIKRGYTQQTLATKINKSKATISSYEKDIQLPPLEVAVDIACALNVSLDFLVGLEQEEHLSLKGLAQEQKEIIELICNEFAKATNSTTELSTDQVRILQKLISAFQQR